MTIQEKLAVFAALVERDQRTQFTLQYPGPNLKARADSACSTHFHIGKRWARVDVGTSGKYMVDMATEEIVGIKAYGVPHHGHHYGTLDTIDEWNWGGYAAYPRTQNSYPAIPADTTSVG